MKQSRILMLAALAAITTATNTVSGQVKVDLKKFPEYSPRVKVDKHLVAKPDVKRPDYVNNAESIYFPPIISQVSNSCGSAAGIYLYVRLRDKPLSWRERQIARKPISNPLHLASRHVKL